MARGRLSTARDERRGRSVTAGLPGCYRRHSIIRVPAVLLRCVGRVNAVTDVADAEDLAEAKLASPLPRRWKHVRSVARRAGWVAANLRLSDDLVAAAWLHDIGYAP